MTETVLVVTPAVKSLAVASCASYCEAEPLHVTVSVPSVRLCMAKSSIQGQAGR